MTQMFKNHNDHNWKLLSVFLILFITISKIVILFFHSENLSYDEAQYWYWSKNLAFGYYSKPPLIAFVISFFSNFFYSDETWAIRIMTPIFHSLTAFMLFLIAHRLKNTFAGFLSVVIWLTLPAINISALVVSTDTLLLFFNTLAIYFLVNYFESFDNKRKIFFIILTAIATALGVLSKYAMIYFPLSLLIFLFFNLSKKEVTNYLIYIFIVLILIYPNIFWNLSNDLQTFNKTYSEPNFDKSNIFLTPLKFFIDQILLFSPLLSFLFIRSLFNKKILNHQYTKLILMIIFLPLIIIFIISLVAKTNANWTALAIPAFIIFLSVNYNYVSKKILLYGIILNVALSLFIFIISLNFTFSYKLKMQKTFTYFKGWETHRNDIININKDNLTIIVDDRKIIASLLYALRNDPIQIKIVDIDGKKDNYYEYRLEAKINRCQNYLYLSNIDDNYFVENGYELSKIYESKSWENNIPIRTINIYKINLCNNFSQFSER